MEHSGEGEQSEARSVLPERAIYRPEKEVSIHFDECQIPAAAPEFSERSGRPRAVEQERHGEAGPAQHPGKQVADTEMDCEEDYRDAREPKKPVRNAWSVYRE